MTTTPQIRTPEEALAEWHEKVALLEEWERTEIELVYHHLTQIMNDHQSSAALAIVRMSLEISRLQQQMLQARAQEELDANIAQWITQPESSNG